jgi:hypothetical protein
MKNQLPKLIIICCLFFSVFTLVAQEIPVDQIKDQIESYKNDQRGPYYRIKWFCKDGSIRDPKDPCPENIGPGIQHATYKQEVEALAKKHHIYLGNILSYSDYDDFWDAGNDHSMVKQYQIVKYLTSVDDGWIYRKGRYYRGAMQSEDEETWGRDYFGKILSDKNILMTDYYLLKESLKDIPHSGDSNQAQLMRSQSKVLAEELPDFMDIRIKIHGNPDRSDIDAVKRYQSSKKSKLTEDQNKKLNDLLTTLDIYYTPVSVESLIEQTNTMTGSKGLAGEIVALLNEYQGEKTIPGKVTRLANISVFIRRSMDNLGVAKDRMILLDLSNKIDGTLFIQSQEWKPKDLRDLMSKIEVLSYAALGSGLIEFWEWDEIKKDLSTKDFKSDLTLEELQKFLASSRGVVEWAAAMVKAVYGDQVNKFSSFEPKAYQFLDDRIRSSVVLDLGKSVSALGNTISRHSSIENDVLGIPQESAIRGLNPGYAFGELVVADEAVESITFSKNKIYVFERPPSGLKPVAGIMTVSEGNLVSHVQLLARNLGVPNAALSNENLKSLKKYNGQKVFYAVSNKGNVIIKLEKDMTSSEKGLFSKEQQSSNKIKVPVDRIKLNQTDIINLRDVNADDSGKICGPKAANLGQLKSIFPDHVVEGFVIPFGIFRMHLDNPMPGQQITYWQYLNNIYTEAEEMKANNKSVDEIDAFQLERLNHLKNAIQDMKLNADFLKQLETEFNKALGSPIGTVPVFLRSDTNMEDLKDFTGAGLNLTLFNVRSRENILNGIKEVWASPYMERSVRWRQKYLLNPEYVFPSIVVIPGVDVDYSGVVISTGINVGEKDDMTVAFSRGAGGAVDGQAAETRWITAENDYLLSPSREPTFVSLPATGGTKENYTSFERPILNKKNVQSIRDLVKEVRVKMPERTDPNYKGAYDMEMGFKNNKLWLFQIRPFVENRKAKSSGYLDSITPKIDYNKKVSLTEKPKL